MLAYEKIGQIDADLSGNIDASALKAVKASLAAKNPDNDPNYQFYVDKESDTHYVNVAQGTDLVEISNPSYAGTVDSAPTDQNGAITVPNSGGTDLHNSFNSTVTVAVEGSAFLYIDKGSFNVVGGAPTFVASIASTDSSNNTIQAGSGTSFIFDGGTGNDLLKGSTSASGKAAIVANGGMTTIMGGLGADTLYGGGHTLIEGGMGAGQILNGGYSSTAADTLVAGTGGNQTLEVFQGANVLDDRASYLGTDHLLTGSGSDTLYTGAAGSDVYLGGLGTGGSATLNGGSGNDNIFVAQGAAYDSINGGGGTDNVNFQGYSQSDIASLSTDVNGVTHLVFNGGQHADISNVTNIYVGGDTIAHTH